MAPLIHSALRLPPLHSALRTPDSALRTAALGAGEYPPCASAWDRARAISQASSRSLCALPGPVRAPVRLRNQARVRRARTRNSTVPARRRPDTALSISDCEWFEDCYVERGPAQGEVVEGYVEDSDVVRLGHPSERLRRALGNGEARFNQFRIWYSVFRIPHLPRGTFRRRQEQVAILEAAQGIQQWIVGLALVLHLLSLAEAHLCLGPL